MGLHSPSYFPLWFLLYPLYATGLVPNVSGQENVFPMVFTTENRLEQGKWLSGLFDEWELLIYANPQAN